MSMLRLAWANLMFRKLPAFISVLLLIFGVGLISMLLTASRYLDTNLLGAIQGVDMVIGAKGSPLQLILANVYHLDNPTGNIPLKQADQLLRNPLIEQSVKLSYGDYYKEYRVLGATPNFYGFYKLTCKEGAFAKKPMEVCLGEDVAAKSGLKIGDHFESAHGEGNGEKHGESYIVTGILNKTGQVADRLIVTSLSSVWKVHGQEGDTTQEKQITSVLVKFRSPMGLFTVPAMINQKTTMMAALPSIEVNRLLTLFEGGFQLLYALAVVIVGLAILSVFFSLLNSLRERKFELALLRLQGASRSKVFTLILLEAIIISLLGSIIGVILGRLGFSGITMAYGNADYSMFEEIFAIDLWLIPGALVVGSISAMIPALTACRVSIVEVLKEK